MKGKKNKKNAAACTSSPTWLAGWARGSRPASRPVNENSFARELYNMKDKKCELYDMKDLQKKKKKGSLRFVS